MTTSAPTELDTLYLYRGTQKVWTIDTDVVLTGATIYFAAYATYPAATVTADDAAVIAKTTADGISITDGAAGTFELTIDETDTYDLALGTEPAYYVYFLKYLPSGGTDNIQIGRGQLIIYADPARAT